MKNDRWVYYKNVTPQDMGGGVACRVLAYSDDMMVMENTFEKGAVGFWAKSPLFWATDTLKQLSCPKLLPRRNQCS